MAAEHWFRWHHGCVTDPKFRVIALRCVTSVTVGHVLAVWASMLEYASQASPRGQIEGWDDEDCATLLGFATEQVCAIRNAMQGKTLNGNTLIAWNKRQPKRNDDSKDRVRNFREKQRDVTQSNAEKHTVTLETETETETETEKANTGTADAGAGQGATKAENCPQAQIIALYHELLPELPPAREWPEANAAQLRSRWRSAPDRQSLDWWRKFFGYVKDSDFLMGRKTDFQASLGWLVKASNFAKVVNGNYENRGSL